jgi:hypothetical protein
MAALNSSSLYVVSQAVGFDLGGKSSTPVTKAGTVVLTNTGRRAVYVKASETLGSTSTVKIGTAYSASSDAGTAGWTANVVGGAATGQYFWAVRTSIN